MAPTDEALDFGLLVALEALLVERHVTRAARRLGVAQSSLSHTLGRLREALGDPLLVRAGRGMVLTPRAEALAGPLGRSLADLRQLVREAQPFEPATCTRAFSLLCPDLLGPVLPRLLTAIDRTAPRARLEVASPSGGILASLASGAHDLALAPGLEAGPSLVRRSLGALRWCVVARRGHPALRGKRRLSREQWMKYAHVVVRMGSATPNLVSQALGAAGLERRVRVTVPGFLVAPFVVADTDHLFTAPRELVSSLAERLGLELCEPPIALPPVPVGAFWHERFHADPGHRWFRAAVIEVVTQVLGASAKERSRHSRST
jgi:DNA-binding transcriptional LysR family regulator